MEGLKCQPCSLCRSPILTPLVQARVSSMPYRNVLLLVYILYMSQGIILLLTYIFTGIESAEELSTDLER